MSDSSYNIATSLTAHNYLPGAPYSLFPVPINLISEQEHQERRATRSRLVRADSLVVSVRRLLAPSMPSR